jgi:hypothetical protein
VHKLDQALMVRGVASPPERCDHAALPKGKQPGSLTCNKHQRNATQRLGLTLPLYPSAVNVCEQGTKLRTGRSLLSKKMDIFHKKSIKTSPKLHKL